MATYGPQPVASGSATAANDVGAISVGVRNDSVAGLNPTNLAYGFYSVDASGRVFIQGPQIQGATYVGNSTRGIPVLGMVTAGDMSAANGNAVMVPFTTDTRGALRSVLSSGNVNIGSVIVSGTLPTAEIVSVVET